MKRLLLVPVFVLAFALVQPGAADTRSLALFSELLELGLKGGGRAADAAAEAPGAAAEAAGEAAGAAAGTAATGAAVAAETVEAVEEAPAPTPPAAEEGKRSWRDVGKAALSGLVSAAVGRDEEGREAPAAGAAEAAEAPAAAPGWVERGKEAVADMVAPHVEGWKVQVDEWKARVEKPLAELKATVDGYKHKIAELQESVRELVAMVQLLFWCVLVGAVAVPLLFLLVFAFLIFSHVRMSSTLRALRAELEKRKDSL